MAITDKTRKKLWSMSGNRCAICSEILIQSKSNLGEELNLGEECHIISARPNGPRHREIEGGDYDTFENLILLCRNDHKQIDEQVKTHTIEWLTRIKRAHESRIDAAINNAVPGKDELSKKIRRMDRIKTGKQALRLVEGSCMGNFDHDELENQKEADVISYFIQYLNDYGEIHDVVEQKEKIKMGFELNSDIKEIEELGFLIFGDQKKYKITSANKEAYIRNGATIIILRKTNPVIFNEDFIIVFQDKLNLSI